MGNRLLLGWAAVAVFAVNVAAAAVVWLYVHEPVGRYVISSAGNDLVVRVDTMSGATEELLRLPSGRFVWIRVSEGPDSSLYRGPTLTPTPAPTPSATRDSATRDELLREIE